MDIPFGKGMLNFVAFSLIGGYSRSLIQTIVALSGETYMYIFPFFGLDLPLWDIVYYTILGIGAIATVIAQYRKGAIPMIQAVVGYTAGLALDAVTITNFVKTLGDGFRTLFLYDIIAQLIYRASESTTDMIITTTATSVLSIATSLLFMSAGMGFAFANAITTALISFLQRLADMFHAYMSRLVDAFARLFATMKEGSIMIIATIAAAAPVASLIITAYAVTFVPMIGLYMWSIFISAVFYLLQLTTNAAILLLSVLGGTTIGSRLSSRAIRGIITVGGRMYRETQLPIYGAFATLIAYLIGGVGMFPYIVAIAVAMCLANAATAARLVIGVPTRRISRYIAAIISITMYGVACKIFASWIGNAILDSLDSLEIHLGFLNIDFAEILKNFPVIGDWIERIESAGYALLQAAQDP